MEGKQDLKSLQVTLSPQSSLSDSGDELTVRTHKADKVYIYVDSGSAGGSPAAYDLTVDRESNETGNTYRHTSKAGVTDLLTTVEGVPDQMTVDLTNATTSATSDNTYRIEVVSVYR